MTHTDLLAFVRGIARMTRYPIEGADFDDAEQTMNSLIEAASKIATTTSITGMHIVIAGGPVDGFNYIGPFKTGADAVDWARNADLGTDWWTAPLEAKEAHEEPDEPTAEPFYSKGAGTTIDLNKAVK